MPRHLPSFWRKGDTLGARIAIVPSLVALNLAAEDSSDAIRQLGSRLVEGGFAGKRYIDAVLSREAVYPTGLEFPSCGVALPHGEPVDVKDAALAIARCTPEVPFGCMDDSPKTTPVRLVALLAVSAPEEHLDVIGHLIGAFSNATLCGKLLELEDPSEVAAVLDKAVNGEAKR